MNTLTETQEVGSLMPQYNLDNHLSVKLVISPETSQRIADLRAHYKKEGREHNSLAKVVEDAVLLLHSHAVSEKARPVNSDEFFYTDPKE